MLYLKLAWRYATRRLVNFIAIAALALALAVQIVAMSVLDGMLVDLEKRLQNLGEQLTLRITGHRPDRETFEAAATDMSWNVRGIAAVTPLFQRVGFMEAGSGAEYVWVQGIDLAEELRHSSLSRHLLSLHPTADNPDWGASGDRPGLFMGENLAHRLGVKEGGEGELYYADRGETGELRTRSRRFQVTSLYRSGVFEKDRYGVYIPLEQAADFSMGDPDLVATMVVWLDDPNQADAWERKTTSAATAILRAITGYEPYIQSDTWQRRWEQMAAGMKHENNLMELVLFLNDAASGFCVFAILVTLVSRRIRDVGLLRCIGAGRRGVMTVFLLVGLIIGTAGGILGVAAGSFLAGPTILETVDGKQRLSGGGAAVTPLAPGEDPAGRRPRIDRWYEAVTGQPLYPPRMFGIADEAGLPTVIYPWKLLLYFLAAVVVSVLAAVYPAAWAACREPMSALREG
ncbi:MAG: FtsX-like permease family protein [Planctomycetes bacterium]|nr:FtsX-like permease family protein [Planctomycetota bacterium]